ncbi:MAG TPA: wax ester/triacylglycerol synthase domain-containing protein [Solirubrobacterales bacterium]|nr:wax ester/triacylglycerol synthase domain-containing protein [Solirubrobacterales bacterium]
MERLSADDARILRLESAAIAGHTLKLALVEPGRDGQPLTLDRLRSRADARLQSLPRARQRLAPTPLRLAPPAWVDDAGFDLRNHVRAAAGVGDRAQLMRLVGSLMAQRLDHAHPSGA